MAANPEKQTAVGLHYLTGRYVCDFETRNSFYVNIYSHGFNIRSLYRFTKYSPVIDHLRCEDFVFAYRRRSFTRIEPQGSLQGIGPDKSTYRHRFYCMHFVGYVYA